MKVENKNAHQSANKVYYYATCVDEAGKIKHLLLTEAKLDKCEDRAKKNREDLPSGFTAIYVQRNTFW